MGEEGANPMGNEHSPLPWRFEVIDGVEKIVDPSGSSVHSDDQYYPSGLSTADAKLIVAAVNMMHLVARFEAWPQVKTQVKLRRLPHGLGLPLPDYASGGAAGVDLMAAAVRIGDGATLVLRDDDLPCEIVPGERLLVGTGFAIELPPGHEAQVRPRSGLAVRHGVTVLNAPGTIDADYRGEVCVLLINHGAEPVTIKRGDRIAQLVIAPVARVDVVEADALGATDRGSGGFGSTGR